MADEATTPAPRGRSTREQLRDADIETLMLQPAFRRFAYCLLMDANLLRGGYGANPATLPWYEGRRSLGLDFLNTLQMRVPDALLQILTEEAKTAKETTIGRRTYDRRDELGTGDPDGRRRNDGYDYLDYGADGRLAEPAAG